MVSSLFLFILGGLYVHVETQSVRYRKMTEALDKALDLSVEPITREFIVATFGKAHASFHQEEMIQSLQEQIQRNIKDNIKVSSRECESRGKLTLFSLPGRVRCNLQEILPPTKTQPN
jgi:hypothetical protein